MIKFGSVKGKFSHEKNKVQKTSKSTGLLHLIVQRVFFQSCAMCFLHHRLE